MSLSDISSREVPRPLSGACGSADAAGSAIHICRSRCLAVVHRQVRVINAGSDRVVALFLVVHSEIIRDHDVHRAFRFADAVAAGGAGDGDAGIIPVQIVQLQPHKFDLGVTRMVSRPFCCKTYIRQKPKERDGKRYYFNRYYTIIGTLIQRFGEQSCLCFFLAQRAMINPNR